MSTDTPQGESGELSIDDAAAEFSTLLNPVVEEESPKVDTEVDPPKEEEPAEEPNATEEGADAPITVEVDGKPVQLTKEQIAEAYKNGLRQSDYTQKTMVVAEQRKAAQAEIEKAQAERATYAQNLSKLTAQLEGAIQEQDKIDWNSLLQSDPMEYLKQQHLYQQRQAALQKTNQETAALQQKVQAEEAQRFRSHLQEQQEQLLAKLPEWKDEAKAKSERDALKKYLTEQGYAPKDVEQISDHKAVILSRKAMLYDQMMAKASAAAKKVEKLPQKVERPGTTSDRGTDGRFQAALQSKKELSVEDASKLFSQIL